MIGTSDNETNNVCVAIAFGFGESNMLRLNIACCVQHMLSKTKIHALQSISVCFAIDVDGWTDARHTIQLYAQSSSNRYTPSSGHKHTIFSMRLAQYYSARKAHTIQYEFTSDLERLYRWFSSDSLVNESKTIVCRVTIIYRKQSKRNIQTGNSDIDVSLFRFENS